MYDFTKPNPISQRSDRLDALRNQMQEWKRRTRKIENEIQDVLKHHRADTAGYIETSSLDQLYAEKFDVQQRLKYVKAQWESQEPRFYEALEHLDSVLDHLLSASMPPPNTRPATQPHSIPTPVESRQCSYRSERQGADSGEDIGPPPRSGRPMAAASDTRKKKRESQPRRKSQPKSLPWRSPTTFSDLDPRVTCLQQGDVVAVLDGKYRKRKRFTPAMVIPWGDCIRFDVNDALSHWGLKDNIPNCYSRAESANAQSWATGYRDNEHLAHKREIPVLYFRRQCNFPKDNKSGWIALKKIKMYDSNCSSTIHKQATNDLISIWKQIYYPDLSPISKKYTTENERMEERILLEEGRRQAREVDQRERCCQEEKERAEQESQLQEQIEGVEQECYDQEEGQGM
ncbi:unnamed protein product [Fusarium equiseti]|uniref:Uncharacterized protein n=1 Tax=Fusarium equiseti TaxID=61235 RepID=A0A8J2IZY1_FUSEQ|nr:unnamed protein product [Fusarium equiseti]